MRWVGRHLVLLLLLIAALAAANWLGTSGRDARGAVTRLEGAEAEVAADVAAQRGRAVTGLSAAERGSQAAIGRRLMLARGELAGLGARPGALDMVQAPRDAIVAAVKGDVQRELLRQEIAFLEALQRNLADRGAALSLERQVAARDLEVARLAASADADAGRIRALAAGSPLDRYAVDLSGVTDLPAFYAKRRGETLARRERVLAERAALVAARQRLGAVAALATPEVAVAALEAQLGPLRTVAAAQREAAEATALREARRWYERLGIDRVIAPALWALAAIILMPFAIRTLFYWVLAPLAALQRPIRLLEAAAPIARPAERSSVSRSVVLAADEELLVKQGFVQTISHGGAKATRWLLDARYPVMSVASGLFFLTRVRGGGATTVSATRDPFAEVAALTLPEGGACVLQPRALVGVVQPIARPLRITSHWRLGTLNAWLTWQLRFLVFHGPATLILKGGRGVRIEAAVAGRSIGQDQLIGFSAGLAYSTGRTETFLPYLFGQEPLLKDRVAAGGGGQGGLLIAEEAPLAGRRGGVAHGLEGALDAVLKVFGI